MKQRKEIIECICNLCGNRWQLTEETRGIECPSCHTHYWNILQEEDLKKIPFAYQVSAPMIDPNAMRDSDKNWEKYSKFRRKTSDNFYKLGFEWKNRRFKLVTRSRENAIEKACKAYNIVVEDNQQYGQGYPDEEEIRVTTYPICPKCHYLGAFSHEWCESCGTELIPAEEISWIKQYDRMESDKTFEEHERKRIATESELKKEEII